MRKGGCDLCACERVIWAPAARHTLLITHPAIAATVTPALRSVAAIFAMSFSGRGQRTYGGGSQGGVFRQFSCGNGGAAGGTTNTKAAPSTGSSPPPSPGPPRPLMQVRGGGKTVSLLACWGASISVHASMHARIFNGRYFRYFEYSNTSISNIFLYSQKRGRNYYERRVAGQPASPGLCGLLGSWLRILTLSHGPMI